MKTPKRWILDKSDELAIKRGCYFDLRKGEHACQFIETFCKQSKGRWGGQFIRLIGWQRKFILRLFGWRQADGRRRFRTCYLEIPKKNGKSTLVSAIALYLEVADGEKAPEIYLNAMDRDQASIVFDEARKMVEASISLRGRFEVIDSRKVMLDAKTNGRIRANSADVAKQDGVNASAVIWDELHRQKTRDMWKIFQHAGISREQPLRLAITTAGESESGPWFEQREYSLKVAAGTIEDVHHLGIVFAIEEGEDVEDPKVWRRVNPSMGEIFSLDDFRADFERAKQEGSDELANFHRLRLGKIVGATGAFLTLEEWDRCALPTFPSEGRPAHLGIDLSSVDDITAVVLLVGDEEEGYDVYPSFFLPRAIAPDLARKHKVPYAQWAEDGLIELTEGEVIDYGYVKGFVKDQIFSSGVELGKVVSDPYNAYKLALELRDEEGLDVAFLRQGYLSLSPPTKELLRLVRAGKIRHGGNKVLRWMVGNAKADKDAAGNVKLSKLKSRSKIDGVAALVNAIAGATISDVDSGKERSVYDDRGVFTVG